MEHLPTLRRLPRRLSPAGSEPRRPRRRRPRGGKALVIMVLAGLLIGAAWPERGGWAAWPRLASGAVGGGASAAGAGVSGSVGNSAGEVVWFGSCHSGGGSDCVVDGDTFRLRGERVRIADIDAPETHPPHCADEARLGDAATDRLQALLNAGPVTLVPIDRDRDRYGRLLRVVERDGRSLGGELVREGLAREWTGRRRPWCAGA